MIRRPKLVGKSVEGAAMQAVAASRKRASSNQFKNVGSAGPARRTSVLAPVKESVRNISAKSSSGVSDAGSKRLGRPPTALRRQKDKEDEDEEMARAKADFRLAIMQKYWRLRRHSSLLRESTLLLSSLWWPRKSSQTLPTSMAEFIVSNSPLAWSDAGRFPPFPSGLVDTFVPLFARWIATFAPHVDLLNTTSKPGPRPSSMLLVSSIKNIRGRKCFTVVKVSMSSEKKAPSIVRCQGWVSLLPRRSKADQLAKADANVTCASFLEKDSAGMDKLASEVHVS